MSKPPGRAPLQPPVLANPPTWLGVPAGLPQRRSAAAILGVPFDCGTHPTRIGSRLGPASIREQTANLRRVDPRSNIDVVAALGLVDAGDVALTPSLIEHSFQRIEAAVDAILSRGAVAVTMGGDGAVTLPQVRALARHARDICVVHIDAHTDAYPIEGFNTATTFRHVAEEGLVNLKRSFHIGARGPTMVPGVFEYARKLGYRLVTMADLRKRGYKSVAAEVLRTVGKRPVYLCFDMDFFDPATAPGVCTPTWGGATAEEGLALLEMLAPLDVRVFDVNTVSPAHDAAGMTAFLAGTVQWTFLQGMARKALARR
ncbi:MAG: arginase family protein [Alphaproteobacteria bacterium]|nr:arginase family protein [Alphaproteobacteria bacterium]